MSYFKCEIYYGSVYIFTHIEIVYADSVAYVGAETQDEGWDDLQTWIGNGNTVNAYA